jgi:hypothetical protein
MVVCNIRLSAPGVSTIIVLYQNGMQ